MPQAFFIEQYRQKASLPDALAQSGRGAGFDAVAFLHSVREVLALLEPARHHSVVDVGSGNGLLDIALSACCARLLALEPVAELATRARANLAGCPGVEVAVAHGAAIPAADGRFDRALMLGVLQLVAPEEAKRICAELRRVVRPDGRVLIGSVPDARGREAFLEPYLAGIDRAAHLAPEVKAAIRERNLRASWYEAEELIAWWRALGAKARRVEPSDADASSARRFHLVVDLAG